MENVSLVDVTQNNWLEICRMYPGDEGNEYVASNAISLVEAQYSNGGHWVTKGIMNQGKIIGFTMYGWSQNESQYELCRFLIDQKFQGRGYGQKALKVIIDELKNEYDCRKVFLGTSPENKRGFHVYEKFGFIQTGEVVDGEAVFVYQVK